MAVFTTLEKQDIDEFISPYGLGELLDFQGISEGMENTNYFLTTSSNHLANETMNQQSGEYVLTVFEELPEEHLPFHVKLLDLLAENELPVPQSLRDYNGQAIQTLKDKPALLAVRLNGRHINETTVEHCQDIGNLLAEFHLVAAEISDSHQGIRDLQWLKQCVHDASSFIDQEDQKKVDAVLSSYADVCKKDLLPKGIIHGDLFRDNAMFDNNRVTGIIDFYSAGEGYLIFDLAVTINDWCNNKDGCLDQMRYEALLHAYANRRPFTDAEKQHWPLILKVCAMRFWLSRLLAKHRHADTHHELTVSKDPEEYRRIFLQHYQTELTLP